MSKRVTPFEIPSKNLNAAFDKVCSIDFTLDKNVDAIREHIAIKRETAVIALSNWKVSRSKRNET